MENKRPKPDMANNIMDIAADVLIRAFELLIAGLCWIAKKTFERENFYIKKISREGLSETQTTLGDDSLGYSISRKKDFPLKELNRSRHSVICGASGFGKSTLLDTLMYDDMKNGKGIVFIDPKGDSQTLSQFIGLCRISGRKFSVFSEHYKGQGLVALNPVKDGSPTNIADRIHYSFNWSEEHYENLCYLALLKTCKALHSECLTVENILEKLQEL